MALGPAWSLGSDVALVESDNSDDEPMPPLLGNAFPFQTTSKAGDRKLWYCSDTMIGSAQGCPPPGNLTWKGWAQVFFFLSQR